MFKNRCYWFDCLHNPGIRWLSCDWPSRWCTNTTATRTQLQLAEIQLLSNLRSHQLDWHQKLVWRSLVSTWNWRKNSIQTQILITRSTGCLKLSTGSQLAKLAERGLGGIITFWVTMSTETKVQDTLNAIWGAIAALNRRMDMLEDKVKKSGENVSF